MLFSTAPWTQLYLYPFLAAIVLWVLLTGLVLWLNRRGIVVARIATLLSLPLLLLAHHQLWLVRDTLTVLAYYQEFAAGMLVWAWHELAFYSGLITGPWRQACPNGIRGWQRFEYAMATHVYHELAIAAEVLVLWYLHRGASNVIGPLVFVLLWSMLHSAKLNVFLGVWTLTVSWLPDHLRYLGSFWRRRAPGGFFAFSLASFSFLTVFLWGNAGMLAGEGRAVGIALLAALTTLGLLEHAVLALPIGLGKTTARSRAPVVSGQLPD